MPETTARITLTITQRGALSRLQNTHGLAPISCAVAVGTLTDDSESVTVRKEAYGMIQTLARAGALEYKPTTETVRVLPVKLQTSADRAPPPAPPQKPEPLTLGEFIARLPLSKARAVWEIILLHREQNCGPLPPRLAERIILRLRTRYRDADIDSILIAPAQVRHLINSLRDYDFLRSTGAKGEYSITPKGLAQAAAVEQLVVPFLSVAADTSKAAHEPVRTDQALTPK